jgi:hypothetical protein
MVRNVPGGVFFLLLIALLSAVGCGRKTMVVPPQTLVPVAVDDLKFFITDEGVRLNWSFPQKTVAGTPLKQIDGFELLRAEVPVADYCAGCPQPFGPPTEIQGGTLPDDGSGRTASFADSTLQPGYHYTYKVRARAGRWGTSQDSNWVGFDWNPSGSPPTRPPQDQNP